jgi:fructosamine-3-kinase
MCPGASGVSLVGGEVRSAVEAALAERHGRRVRLVLAQSVGGGSINAAARIGCDRGRSYFLKWNASAPSGMFAAEADGLRALRDEAARCGLRVPEVVALGGEGAAASWLLLEWVPRGSAGDGRGERLGSGLALLHRSRAGGAGYGWERGNFIGSLPQPNDPSADWGSFWRDRRLAPQLELARRRGRLARAEAGLLDELLDRTGEALAGAATDGPSLVHGDLWSGNAYAGPAGEPVLVDPAVYRGHREVDLAMSELFGGFPAGWLDAYREAWPLDPSYAPLRRPIYQLYYLLVHVNLFGGSYVSGSLRAAREVLERL